MQYLLNVHILLYVYHFLHFIRNNCIFCMYSGKMCTFCLELQILFACILVKPERPLVHYY